MADDKAQISLKIEKELLDKIDKSAKEEDRSRSNQIIRIIKKYYHILEDR